MTTRRRILSGLKSPMGLVATTGLLLMLVLAAVSPWLWGSESTRIDASAISQPPNGEHVLGTDSGGRDVLARTLVAARLSITMALAATTLGVVLGIILGCLPAVVGRNLGRLLTAGVNLAVAFPALLLAIFLSVVLGQGVLGAVLAVGFAIAPNYARLANTLSSSIGGRDFISAARILGVSRFGILYRHILPNIREPLIVSASITAGNALIAFTGLSFLGLGVQAPQFDWGRMLNEGLSRIYLNPATALAPGVAVIIAGLLFAVFGEVIARSLGIRPRLSGRLPDVLERPQESDDGHLVDVPTSKRSEANVLTVRNLRVGVPSGDQWTYPVKGVSFGIAAGELVGLVGQSGSGKSLLATSIAGLTERPLHVTAGQLTFHGIEMAVSGSVPSRVRSRALARTLGTRLAMVFQDPMSSLNPAIKIGAQVAEIGFLHAGLSKRAAMQRALQRIASVKIPDPPRRARQYPHELSGGMRQRSMIAMGLMGAPALIIADEPTTALDVTVQRDVLALLNQIRADVGSAILLISHDMAVVTGMCSRVLVMYNGHIVENIMVTDLVRGCARHPYTRALLAAVPTMTGDRGRKLATIPEGQEFEDQPVPERGNAPKGVGGEPPERAHV